MSREKNGEAASPCRSDACVARLSDAALRFPSHPCTPHHPITHHPRYAVPGEDVAAEEEEEDGALEHGGDGRRQAERHLNLVSTDGERGQQKGHQDGAEGVQSPQPGDDDRGVAIAW